jgi:uncharacterized protein (DUF2062 family)
VALSFGIGVFIGMSPLFGLHTILGIAAAWIFKLNKFVTIVGVYITNPWTIIPIYTFATWFGAKLLGVRQILFNINWNEISLHHLLYEMQSLLPSFLLGTTVLSFISGIAGYVIIYQMILRNKKGIV